MMTRKQFLRSALSLSATALGLTVLSSCTGSPRTPAPDGSLGRIDAPPGGLGSNMGSGSGSAPTSRCAQAGTQVTIGDNHGHILVVSEADIAAGGNKSYDIQGTSDHPHTVTLSADDFAALGANNAIMTTSTFDDGHDHSILVACA
jgi:hypothetical protein